MDEFAFSALLQLFNGTKVRFGGFQPPGILLNFKKQDLDWLYQGSKIKVGQMVILSEDGHELIIELETQIRCSFGRCLNSPNPPLGHATASRPYRYLPVSATDLRLKQQGTEISSENPSSKSSASCSVSRTGSIGFVNMK